MTIYFVSRHPGAIEWARRRALEVDRFVVHLDTNQIHLGDVVIGTYACMDGVVPEVPRSLAVRGARLLLNSLNSFALDEASTHIPVRAAENRAWLVACCKIGPLLPPDRLAEFSANMGVPGSMLRGAVQHRTAEMLNPKTGNTVKVGIIRIRSFNRTNGEPSALTDPLRLSIEERLQAMLPGLVDAISASIRADLQGLVQEAVTQAIQEARQQVEADAREATSASDNRPRRL